MVNVKSLFIICFIVGCQTLSVEAQPKVTFNFSKNQKSVAYYNIAVNHIQRKEYDKAIESFKTSIELDPKNLSSYYNMGICYTNIENYDKAIEMYSKAIEINPEYAEAYFNMAVAQSEKQLLEDAKENYLNAVKYKADLPEAHANLAMIYFYEGNTNDYQEHVNILKTLNPEIASQLEEMREKQVRKK